MPYVLFFRKAIVFMHNNFASDRMPWFIFPLRHILYYLFIYLLLLIYNESWQEFYFIKVENENIGLK